MGSAFSSLITQFFTAGIQIYFAYKIFNFKINYRLIIALLVFIAGIVIFNYASRSFSQNWIINFGIMIVFCGLCAFVSGLISLKSIFRFLKYK